MQAQGTPPHPTRWSRLLLSLRVGVPRVPPSRCETSPFPGTNHLALLGKPHAERSR